MIIKILLVVFIFINLSSCNVINTIVVASEFIISCKEPELFPSKKYDALINANYFFRDGSDIYKLRSNFEGSSKLPTLHKIDTSCCSCADSTIEIIKNNEANYREESVSKVSDYLPEKLFFVIKKYNLIYEFNITEKDLLYDYRTREFGKTFSFARGQKDYVASYYGGSPTTLAVILLKNKQNKEILIRSSMGG